jgi:hypothetical protein
MKFNINGIKVISVCLNKTISNVKRNTTIQGKLAISGHTFGANHLKIIYPIAQPIIKIISCFRLNHKNIGSSFSICTGILYCIKK